MNEHKLKEQICEIGRRLYAKGFAAANDGNITIRLNDREVLCTPTMVSKGFLKPEDICKVDYEGKQLAGTKKRTSEVLLHLAVYKARPDVNGRRPLPSAARHRLRRRPGADPQVRAAGGRGLPRRSAHRRVRDARRPEVRRHVLPYVKDCNTIILANHGTVTFGPDLEKAYFNTEIIDAYCKILILAKQLGRVNYFSEEQTTELLALKKRLGYDDVSRFQHRRAMAPSCAATSSLRRSGYSDFDAGAPYARLTAQGYSEPTMCPTTACHVQRRARAMAQTASHRSTPDGMRQLVRHRADHVMETLAAGVSSGAII